MSTPDIDAGFYFVAFVDLLGQRAKLAQFSKVAPKTEQELAEFQSAIANTAGVVRNVRDSIERWLLAAKEINQDALAKMPPERRDEFTKIITPATFQSGFSDSFVVAFPMHVS